MIAWTEIPATDIKRAEKFYGDLLGAKFSPLKMDEYEYAMFDYNGDNSSAALVKGQGYNPAQEGITIYLSAAPDMSPLLEKVPSLGGSVIMDKTYAGPEAGYIAFIIDSEGNKIGLQHY